MKRITISILLILVFVLIVTPVVSVNASSCPTATNIAQDYLKETWHIEPGDGDWSYVINAVAHETGTNGILWAANACDPGYADAVRDFVNKLFPD